MKVIFHAKDLGYTDAYNLGAIKAVDDGAVSAAGVMLGMPGADSALLALKYRKWVTLVWQPDCEGLDTLEQQPLGAVVDKLRRNVENCIRIYGQAPYAAQLADGKVGEAMQLLCDDYGIKYGYAADWDGTSANIFVLNGRYAGFGMKTVSEDLYGGKGFEAFGQYKPLDAIASLPGVDGVFIVPLRPGFLDDIVMAKTVNTDYSIHRLADQQLLCSEKLQKLIAYKHIEIVSLRDVVDGTKDYQNHLKALAEK